MSVLELGKIGRHFDSDRPFFGLQPAGLVAGEPVHDTVPEMAEHYVDAIKSLQPHGPYLIGGHCDGSWVAHETARQLSDHGDEVGYIAMVDPAPPPDEFTTSRGTRRILDRLRYYARHGRLIPAIRWQVTLRLDKLLVLRFGDRPRRSPERGIGLPSWGRSRTRPVIMPHTDRSRRKQGATRRAPLGSRAGAHEPRVTPGLVVRFSV